MESCHANFVTTSPISNIQKNLYGELKDYTWKFVMQIL